MLRSGCNPDYQDELPVERWSLPGSSPAAPPCARSTAADGGGAVSRPSGVAEAGEEVGGDSKLRGPVCGRGQTAVDEAFAGLGRRNAGEGVGRPTGGLDA